MFGENLRNLRIIQGYTQQQMAKKLNISRPSYTRYETGEREPDFKTMVKISELLQVSIDFLINGKKNNDHHLQVVENSKGDIAVNGENSNKLMRMGVYAFVIEDMYEHINWLCVEISKIVDAESLELFLESIYMTRNDFDAWSVKKFDTLPTSWQLQELLKYYRHCIKYVPAPPAPIHGSDEKAYETANRLMNEAIAVRNNIPNINIVDQYVQSVMPIIINHLKSNEKDEQLAAETAARLKAVQDATRTQKDATSTSASIAK